MQMNKIDWSNLHRFQEKPGWCGSAVIQMALLAMEIEKTQTEIAKDVYLDWWGSNQQIIFSYLSQFVNELGIKNNSTLDDIREHFLLGHIVIVNWWDDMDKDDEEGGHYSIVGGYDNNVLTLVDPTNARSGIWTIKDTEFEKRWFDYLDTDNKVKSIAWMLWLSPASKK